MVLNSLEFIVFLAIVALVYRMLPDRLRAVGLLAANVVFYASYGSLTYGVVLAFVLGVSYASAILIDRTGVSKRHGWMLACALCAMLAPLAFFKYSSFMLTKLGIGTAVLDSLPLVAPVGISFFTFQAMGYVIDVYRGDVEAERNPVVYAAFGSFFPTIISGPIQRSHILLKQIRIGGYRCSSQQLVSGCICMLWGAFLKVVLADRAGVFVDEVYDSYFMYGQYELVLATLFYSLQILCDFAGYSCMAVGAARIMGFDIPENFNTPYLAITIRDFWRRWHISLGGWLRDYLYIPLGGSRCSAMRHYLNVCIVFLVCGVWHGAGLSFVVWGLLHGLFQSIGIATEKARYVLYARLRFKTSTVGWKLCRMAVTFALVSFCWVFFRAGSLAEALEMLRLMATKWNPWVLFDGSLLQLGLTQTDFNVLLVGVLLLAVFAGIKYVKGLTIEEVLIGQPMGLRWAFCIVLAVGIFVFGMYGPAFNSSYIYAAF